LWPLVPIGAAVFCLSALIYFRVQYEVVQVRSAMQVMIAGIYQAIGFAPAVMFFLLLLTWSSIWFVTGRLERPLMRIGRLLAMAVMMGVFLNLGDGGVAAATHKGVVGAWLAGCLVGAIGYYPSIVLVWAITFASLLLATDFFFSDSFERLRQRPRGEVGVETAVTDHLRGLGALAAVGEPVPRPGPAAPDAPAAASGAPELDFLRELPLDEAPLVGTDDFDDAERADDARRFEPRRRRSYFDRRHADDEADAAPDAAAERSGAAEVDVTAAAEWAPGPSVDESPLDAEPLPAESYDAEVGPAAIEPATAAAAEPEHGPPPDDRPVPLQSFVAIEDTPQGDEADDDEANAAVEPEVEVEAEPATPMAAVEPGTADLTDAASAAAADDAAADDDAADDDAAGESLVAIPRPDQTAREWQPPSAPRTPSRPPDAPVRQQKLFAADVDEDLLQEALEVVDGQSRVTAVLLQRRLRIDYQQAMDVLRQLGARGVLELDADATQGRVVV